MKTVNEVSKLTGVSIRTLQYYDKIGLLKPAEYTESGYRLYDDAALERLQQILLFRELEFPLKDIKDIVTRSDFDKRLALDQQIELLELKKVLYVQWKKRTGKHKINESYEAVTVTPEGSNIGVNMSLEKFYDAVQDGTPYDRKR